MLTDERFRFRNELPEFHREIGFESENGKTSGALAPNEFWYFWRRFFPALTNGFCDSRMVRATAKLTQFRNSINGLSNIFRLPLAMKALILNQHLEFLTESFTNPIFVWLRRDPVYNIQSVLNARMRQYGTMIQWYSFKIKEYEQLKDLDPLYSVAGQIFAINASVEKYLDGIPEANKLIVQYEDFCRNPRQAYEELISRLAAHGNLATSTSYRGVHSFADTNAWSLKTYSRVDAARAYEEIPQILSQST